jgi:hypothetical protein
MTKPILTTTEYDALCNVLEWAWTSLHQEPELCLKDIDYSSASKVVKQEHTEAEPDKGLGPGLHTEYEPTGVDPIKTGECGLGLAEAFEYTLNEPNQRNVMTMIETLMYKLNCNPCLANGLGNSWETLAPLVDNTERDRLEETSDDPDITTQTLEGYVIESIGLKNKVARLQEHYENVNEVGYVQVGENLWIDGGNSDLTA